MKFVGNGPVIVAFDLGASGFDEFSVLNAGRARGHAGDTAKARIKVADPFFVDLGFAFGSHFHEVDAAARRIHFFSPKNVGGAGGEAEAAMDALID